MRWTQPTGFIKLSKYYGTKEQALPLNDDEISSWNFLNICISLFENRMTLTWSILKCEVIWRKKFGEIFTIAEIFNIFSFYYVANRFRKSEFLNALIHLSFANLTALVYRLLASVYLHKALFLVLSFKNSLMFLLKSCILLQNHDASHDYFLIWCLYYNAFICENLVSIYPQRFSLILT